MHNRTVSFQPSLQTLKIHSLRWALCLILLTLFAIPGAQWFVSRANASASALPPQSIAKATTWSVSAAGRIEPRDGPLTIAAPSWDASPAIVTTLHVSQGNWVTRGTVLAELRGRIEFRALLATKEQHVGVAQARLVALTAGGKQDDIRALRAEIESEEAALAQIQSDTVRSHQLLLEGVIRSGPASPGLAADHKTSEMFVDAEVAEQDLPRVRQGQHVAITGDVLPAGTSGVVEEIGYLVDSREVLTDPTAFSDARIVHVKIRGEDPAALERFINARVRVEIQP